MGQRSFFRPYLHSHCNVGITVAASEIFIKKIKAGAISVYIKGSNNPGGNDWARCWSTFTPFR